MNELERAVLDAARRFERARREHVKASNRYDRMRNSRSLYAMRASLQSWSQAKTDFEIASAALFDASTAVTP